MGIKLIIFEVDHVLWRGSLSEKYVGRGSGASSVPADNLRLKQSGSDDRQVVEDRSDTSVYVTLGNDIPRILKDIDKRGITIAISSNNSSKSLCDRALSFFHAADKNQQDKAIIKFVSYDEVSSESKVEHFKRMKGWSGTNYDEMLLFDYDPSKSKKVKEELGANLKLVGGDKGLEWDVYEKALQDASKPTKPSDGRPPPLGKRLGSGHFADVYLSKDDPEAVIKVLKFWDSNTRKNFFEVFKVISAEQPFQPDNTEEGQYMAMLAFELRNLNSIQQLKAPKPEEFNGWFSMMRIGGNPIWEISTYHTNPFSVPFQQLLKRAFHLGVDELEMFVKDYGIEHRDPHFGNFLFTLKDGWPVQAHLLDWGFAVRMDWDGSRYIRKRENLTWNSGDHGQKFTPDEFRKYWITWMVKTEYEAQIKRHGITKEDGDKFLNDLGWWFRADR